MEVERGTDLEGEGARGRRRVEGEEEWGEKEKADNAPPPVTSDVSVATAAGAAACGTGSSGEMAGTHRFSCRDAGVQGEREGEGDAGGGRGGGEGGAAWGFVSMLLQQEKGGTGADVTITREQPSPQWTATGGTMQAGRLHGGADAVAAASRDGVRGLVTSGSIGRDGVRGAVTSGSDGSEGLRSLREGRCTSDASMHSDAAMLQQPIGQGGLSLPRGPFSLVNSKIASDGEAGSSDMKDPGKRSWSVGSLSAVSGDRDSLAARLAQVLQTQRKGRAAARKVVFEGTTAQAEEEPRVSEERRRERERGDGVPAAAAAELSVVRMQRGKGGAGKGGTRGNESASATAAASVRQRIRRGDEGPEGMARSSQQQPQRSKQRRAGVAGGEGGGRNGTADASGAVTSEPAGSRPQEGAAGVEGQSQEHERGQGRACVLPGSASAHQLQAYGLTGNGREPDGAGGGVKGGKV